MSFLFLHVERLQQYDGSQAPGFSTSDGRRGCPYARVQLVGDIVQSALIPGEKPLQFRIRDPSVDILQLTVHDILDVEGDELLGNGNGSEAATASSACIGHLTLPLRCVVLKEHGASGGSTANSSTADIWRVEYQLETTANSSPKTAIASGGTTAGLAKVGNGKKASLQLVLQYLPAEYIAEYRQSRRLVTFERTMEDLRRHFVSKVSKNGHSEVSPVAGSGGSLANSSGTTSSSTNLRFNPAKGQSNTKSTACPESAQDQSQEEGIMICGGEEQEVPKIQEQAAASKPSAQARSPFGRSGFQSFARAGFHPTSRPVSRGTSPSSTPMHASNSRLNFLARSRAGSAPGEDVGKPASDAGLHPNVSRKRAASGSSGAKTPTGGGGASRSSSSQLKQATLSELHQGQQEVKKLRGELLEAEYSVQALTQQLATLHQEKDLALENCQTIIDSQTRTIAEKSSEVGNLQGVVVADLQGKLETAAEGKLLLQEEVRLLSERLQVAGEVENEQVIRGCRIENTELAKRVSKMRQQADGTNKVCEELQRKIETLQEELRVERKRCDAKVESVKDECGNLKQSVREAGSAAESLKKELGNTQAELHVARQRSLELEAEKEAQRTIAANTLLEVERLRVLLDQRNAETEQKDVRLLEFERQESLLHLQVRKLEADVTDFRTKERNREMLRERDAIAATLAEQSNVLTRVSNEYVEELESENALLKQQFDRLLAEHKTFVAGTQTTYNDFRKKADERTKNLEEELLPELASLKSENVRLEAENADLKEVREKKLPGVEKRFLQLRDQFEFQVRYGEKLGGQVKMGNALADELREQAERQKGSFESELAKERLKNADLAKDYDELSDKLARVKAKLQHLHATRYQVYPHDPIDQVLARWIVGLEPAVPFFRISQGQYLFGKRQVAVQINNEKPVFRVGGGFLSFEEFLDKFEAEELDKHFLSAENLARNKCYQEVSGSCVGEGPTILHD